MKITLLLIILTLSFKNVIGQDSTFKHKWNQKVMLHYKKMKKDTTQYIDNSSIQINNLYEIFGTAKVDSFKIEEYFIMKNYEDGSNNSAKKLLHWDSANFFEPELLEIPKSVDSTFDNEVFDTIPNVSQSDQGGGEIDIVKSVRTVKNLKMSKQQAIKNETQINKLSLSDETNISNKNRDYLSYCDSNSLPRKISDLQNSISKNYVIKAKDTGRIKYFFPEVNLEENEYDFIREISKTSTLTCNNKYLRVGIAVRIIISVYSNPENLQLNSLESIAMAVEKFRVQATYTISLLGISDESFLFPSGSFNIDGFKTAMYTVHQIIQSLNSNKLKIAPQILSIN